jgi:hypothetical protein
MAELFAITVEQTPPVEQLIVAVARDGVHVCPPWQSSSSLIAVAAHGATAAQLKIRVWLLAKQSVPGWQMKGVGNEEFVYTPSPVLLEVGQAEAVDIVCGAEEVL